MPRFCRPRSWFWCCWGCRLFLVPFGSNYAIWGPARPMLLFFPVIHFLFVLLNLRHLRLFERDHLRVVHNRLWVFSCQGWHLLGGFRDFFTERWWDQGVQREQLQYSRRVVGVARVDFGWFCGVLHLLPQFILIARNFKRTRLRHAMPHCGHRLFLEGWQGISAEDFDFLESFW